MTDKLINWKGPQPAPTYMARLLRVNFPQITQTGIHNNRNVAGTKTKSSHAEGRGAGHPPQRDAPRREGARR